MRYSKMLRPLTFLCDLVILNVALQSAHFIVFRYYSDEIHTTDFLLLVNLCWLLIALLTKNYVIRRPLVLSEDLNRFVTSTLYHLVLVMGIVYFFKLYEVSRSQMIFTYLLFFALIIIERSLIFSALDYLRRRGFNIKHILIIGDEEIAKRVKKVFHSHPEYGYNFIGNITGQTLATLNRQMLFDKINETGPNEIFICYRVIDQSLLKSIIDFGDQNSIKIKLVSDLVLENSFATVINYESFPVIQLSNSMELSLKIIVFKRCFDILFSLFVMLPGMPLFVILMIVTKLTSKGPVFYAQERIGKNKKPFKIYKFRSMFVNSEALGPQLSSENDPRITKWGRVIRKSRLDELPQFWNVLKGEMSIVGPRPERQFFIEQLLERSPNYKKLLHLKPGLTSLGQVNYGYAENVDQMCNRVRYDLLYLNNIKLSNDVGVILKTIKVMTQLKGK